MPALKSQALWVTLRRCRNQRSEKHHDTQSGRLFELIFKNPSSIQSVTNGGHFPRSSLKLTIPIQQRTLPKDSPYFAASWMVLGKILTQTGRAVEAERYLRDALALRTRTVKNSHWSIAPTEGAIGECLTAQRHNAEAEPMLIESYNYNSLKDSQGEQNPRTVEARQRLVKFYEAWAKPAEAARYRLLIYGSMTAISHDTRR